MPVRHDIHAQNAYDRRVDLRSLRTFQTVAATGSVSAAAGILRVSQPALSRQIQALERELGLALFLRRKRRLELTAAGRTFLEAAAGVLASAEAAGTLAAALAAGRISTVRMAAPTTTLTDVLAPFLAELRPEDPLITVEEASYAAAVESLRTGLDLAVLTAPPPRGLSAHRVAVLPVWAYVAATHPWAQRAEVSVAELAEQRLIVLDPTAGARRLLDEALLEEGLAEQRPAEQGPAGGDVIECRNPQVAQALAAAGRGVAVLSDDPRFGLHPLGIRTARGPLTLTLHAGWDPQHHAAPQLEQLAVRLREFCAARYPSTTASTTATAPG